MSEVTDEHVVGEIYRTCRGIVILRHAYLYMGRNNRCEITTEHTLVDLRLQLETRYEYLKQRYENLLP